MCTLLPSLETNLRVDFGALWIKLTEWNHALQERLCTSEFADVNDAPNRWYLHAVLQNIYPVGPQLCEKVKEIVRPNGWMDGRRDTCEKNENQRRIRRRERGDCRFVEGGDTWASTGIFKWENLEPRWNCLFLEGSTWSWMASATEKQNPRSTSREILLLESRVERKIPIRFWLWYGAPESGWRITVQRWKKGKTALIANAGG